MGDASPAAAGSGAGATASTPSTVTAAASAAEIAASPPAMPTSAGAVSVGAAAATAPLASFATSAPKQNQHSPRQSPASARAASAKRAGVGSISTPRSISNTGNADDNDAPVEASVEDLVDDYLQDGTGAVTVGSGGAGSSSTHGLTNSSNGTATTNTVATNPRATPRQARDRSSDSSGKTAVISAASSSKGATKAATKAAGKTAARTAANTEEDGPGYRSVIRPGSRVLGAGGSGFGLGDKTAYEQKLYDIKDKLSIMSEQIAGGKYRDRDVAKKGGKKGQRSGRGSSNVQDNEESRPGTVEEDIDSDSKPGTPGRTPMGGLGRVEPYDEDEEIPEDIAEKPRTPGTPPY